MSIKHVFNKCTPHSSGVFAFLKLQLFKLIYLVYKLISKKISSLILLVKQMRNFIQLNINFAIYILFDNYDIINQTYKIVIKTTDLAIASKIKQGTLQHFYVSLSRPRPC